MLCESCKRLIEMFGTNEFAVPWRCKCDAQNAEQKEHTIQHQLSLTGSGDFCRLGCCDFSQKYAKHTCKKEERS
jgi:hypothetical protein